MKNSIRKTSRCQTPIRWLVLATLTLIAVGAVTRKVRADVSCAPVRGTITSVFTTKHCTSPVGLCTVGTITGAGPLDGATTSFLALLVASSAGMPTVEPAANLSYSGQLTLVTTNGTLVTNDLGVVDAAHSAFTEIERPASGTGVFANSGNNAFFISGSIVNNGQGFQGNRSGVVCANDN
jgi:hypothetical protein